MKAIIKFSLSQFLFWWLANILSRLLFIIYNQYYFKPFDWKEVLNSFWHGMRLDWSMASYISIVSVLLISIYRLWNKKIFITTSRIWAKISIAVLAVITIADAVVYSHWQTKINPMAISFLKSPREVMASAGADDQVMLMCLLLVLGTILLYYVYNFIFSKIEKEIEEKGPKLISFITSIFLLALFFLGIRGGLQLEPINQSSAYFSDKTIYNHAALNTTWNLMNKYVLSSDKKSDYIFGDDKEVSNALNTFYSKQKAEYKITQVNNPNILFIILEGFTADVISALGGEKGLTPCIDSLMKEGVLWKNFYGNGDRTYKGLPAILNGWPTRPIGSVTQDADQSLQLPSIAKTLKTNSYYSSFYYGGESEFANIKSYLINTGFDRITDIHDFPVSMRGLKWGVSDHFVFERLANELDQNQKPFFSTLLTLSTHEPYDIPVSPKIKGNSPADKFRNTVIYTDESLHTFINTIKSKPWYDSTLIVLTADHGNHLPKNHQTNFEPARFKIPLLIFGGALVDSLRGLAVNTIGSHNDIAFSILSALGYETNGLEYAHQLFSYSNGAAFYTFDNGFGMMTPTVKYCYDYSSNKVIFTDGMLSDSLLTLGKLLMQGTQKK